VLHGLGNGTTALIFKGTPAIFFGRRHLGAISGCLSTLNVGSTAIGPLLVGASFDVLGSYTLCVRGIAVATAGMALLVLGMRPPVREAAQSGGVSEHGAIEMACASTEGELSASAANAGAPAAKLPTAARGKRAKVSEAYAKLDE